jgi:hypothetical protein
MVYTDNIKRGYASMTTQATKRISVTFPADLSQEIGRSIPNRERNRFIVEATEKEMRRRQMLRALAESEGAWSDTDHSDLRTAEDIECYERSRRESWRWPLRPRW